ncbi:MAG: hypothetical protein AB1486_01995 [Planctomycetota bacterium]
MNCQDVEHLLELRDSEAKLDRVALVTHLERCPACRDRYPEVAAYLAQAQPSAAAAPAWRPPKRRGARLTAVLAASAAIILLGISATWLMSPAQETKPLAAPDTTLPPSSSVVMEPGGRVRQLPLSVSTVVNSTVTYNRDRQFELRVRHSTWSPPAPRREAD